MNMRRRKIERVETRKLWDENPVEIPLQKSRKRALVIVTVILCCFAAIFMRLIDLMILDHDKLSGRAAQQYNREKTLKAQRGVIWDRKMREMAGNIESDSLYAVPSKIGDTRSLAKEIAFVTKVSSNDLNNEFLKKKHKDFIWIDRQMDMETSREVRKFLDRTGYDEVGVVPESRRYYPKGQTAAHILGFTNIDNAGISGLEMKYNDYLKGEARNVSVGTDARGNRLSNSIKDAVSGNNLVLTIDEGIQHIVERELAEAMVQWKARAAAAIMMNPMTGEILAMANMPTYDPNDTSKTSNDERRNRALTDLYEPGSTFKAVLASAALEEEVVKLHNTFDTSKGFIVVGGKPVRDVHKHGVLTFKEVIQKSSNVGCVQVGLRLGEKRYYNYIKKFGFGEKTGIDFPGEAKGLLRNPAQWSGTSIAAMSIGQEIGVTPLQVLRAYAAIANGGILVKPYIVSDIISPEGKVVERVIPDTSNRIISRNTAATVKDILKTVVEEGGTATQAYIKGNLVAGKTGTAQVFDNELKHYSSSKYISSFVGFVPADNPKLALIVVVYEPQGGSYGGVVAAPVFKKIVENTFAYIDVPLETEENQIYLVSKSR